MILYWKSATNEIFNENDYLLAKEKAVDTIKEWGRHHLYLESDLLDNFVTQKVEEFARSFIKVSLPFETEGACRQYLKDFYQEHLDVISVFPYDRWAWLADLETICYGDYQVERVNVESRLFDIKETLH